MVAVYAASHFLVDFACAFLMFRSIAGAQDAYVYVLLYNFFAFAVQMPLGLLADRCNRNALFAACGCVLVAIAYGCAPALACVVLGLGNALFHIGGGVDILNHSESKSAALGIFVSPGAFGVYFGTILGSGSGAFTAYILAALLLFAALIFAMPRTSNNATVSLRGGRGVLFTAVCLFLVVCLRSYAGMTMNFAWKARWGIPFIFAVVFGKTLGGFAADRFGMMKTSVLSLGVAALLFFFSAMPLPGVIAVLLFNMTMPVTLWALAKRMPGAKGFSFGLLTFALFLGFLPVYLGAGHPPNVVWVFSAVAVLSLVLLTVGLRKVKP
jgi:FSR family fosmidomycin resistance protein-like MFS transporter